MHAWLEAAADQLSRDTGVSRRTLDLTNREIEALLDAAGFAAHESGARTNAPLLCYLIGRASAEKRLTVSGAAKSFTRSAVTAADSSS